MKKEKWLLKEIESWQEKQIINDETANTLKTMYQPKKSIALLMILFSIIGSVLIGMGVVLLSANNWWYSLPLLAKTIIGFLPLLISQGIVLFVYKHKMNSVAFRESAAVLNMSGVFASIALVGQILHIPGDFTNYLLVCGLLFLPTMLVMDAISPLIVYYWAAINGGVYFSEELGVVISASMFAIGATFALKNCSEKNGKSIYLSLITVISAFALILTTALKGYSDLPLVLYGFALLLVCTPSRPESSKEVFSSFGKVCFLILTFVLTYRTFWDYGASFDDTIFLILSVLIILSAIAFFVNSIIAKKYCLFAVAASMLLAIRGVWCIFDLTQNPVIFTVICNVILLALSVLCIFDGARKIDLYNANLGMVTLCTLIVMRFFDSDLSLATRGVVFLILGAGFLLFNLYLVKTKKKIKEEAK